MADDIVTRLRIIHCAADDLIPCGTCLTCQAADEIERLRKIIAVEAAYELTFHVARHNSYRTTDDRISLDLQQDKHGAWWVVLLVDGGYSNSGDAQRIMQDVWLPSLVDACRVLQACYRERNMNLLRGPQRETDRG